MSYMREPYYAYIGSGSDGEDALYIDGMEIALSSFDELVLMRVAQLSPDEFTAAAHRAVRRYAGNVGCNALATRMGKPGFYESLEKTLAGLREEEK